MKRQAKREVPKTNFAFARCASVREGVLQNIGSRIVQT